MKIGQKLKEKRLELGLTQQQAADMIGVTQSTFSIWEREERVSKKHFDAVKAFVGADVTLQSPAVEPDLELPTQPPQLSLFRYMVLCKEGPCIQIVAETVECIQTLKLFVFKIHERRVAAFKMNEVIGFYEIIEIEM